MSPESNSYALNASIDPKRQTTSAALHLKQAADETLVRELSECNEVIGPVTASPDLRQFLFGYNRAYTTEEVGAAIAECVTRLEKRQSYQQPAYGPRWELGPHAGDNYDFVARIYPLTDGVIAAIGDNPAVFKTYVFGEDKENGILWIALRPTFAPGDVQPDLEELLNKFVGENAKEADDKS